jgi:hypothetical protein
MTKLDKFYLGDNQFFFEHHRRLVKEIICEHDEAFYNWVVKFAEQATATNSPYKEDCRNLIIYPEELIYFMLCVLEDYYFIENVTHFHPLHSQVLVRRLMLHFKFIYAACYDKDFEKRKISDKLYISSSVAFLIGVLNILKYDRIGEEMQKFLNDDELANPWITTDPYSDDFNDEALLDFVKSYDYESYNLRLKIDSVTMAMCVIKSNKNNKINEEKKTDISNKEFLDVLKDIAASLKNEPRKVEQHFHDKVGQVVNEQKVDNLTTK